MDTHLQGALAAAEERLQGMAAEKSSLEAQLRAAQLEASPEIQVASQTPFALHFLFSVLSRTSVPLLKDAAASCPKLLHESTG